MGAGLKGIGTSGKDEVPSLAIVDGQQRLTSLYAVMTGAEVIRADYSRERIRIAFDPLSERFEVPPPQHRTERSFPMSQTCGILEQTLSRSRTTTSLHSAQYARSRQTRRAASRMPSGVL